LKKRKDKENKNEIQFEVTNNENKTKKENNVDYADFKDMPNIYDRIESDDKKNDYARIDSENSYDSVDSDKMKN